MFCGPTTKIKQYSLIEKVFHYGKKNLQNNFIFSIKMKIEGNFWRLNL